MGRPAGPVRAERGPSPGRGDGSDTGVPPSGHRAGPGPGGPQPLGLRREDRFLYLGKPEEPLTPGCWVEWNGTGYEVQTAHPIQAGGRTSHVWAVLRPRDREAGA